MPADDFKAGDIISERYKLVREIGRGGFGIVFKAIQLGMERDVALKILHVNGTFDPNARERFKREALVVRNLNHPNTIRQYEFGETENGSLFLVLEYLQGLNLVEMIRRDGALGDVRTKAFASGILKSLSEAHAQGIIHRDLKPGNIMLCDIYGETDYPKVLDFGIAKVMFGDSPDLTGAGIALGSPRYMAPEILNGETPTPAADVYSIAISFAESIIGQPLFESKGSLDAAKIQLDPAPLPIPDILKESSLWPWLSLGLTKDISRRYKNAEEMLNFLDADIKTLAARGADFLADVDTRILPLAGFETSEADDVTGALELAALENIPGAVIEITPDDFETDVFPDIARQARIASEASSLSEASNLPDLAEDDEMNIGRSVEVDIELMDGDVLMLDEPETVPAINGNFDSNTEIIPGALLTEERTTAISVGLLSSEGSRTEIPETPTSVFEPVKANVVPNEVPKSRSTQPHDQDRIQLSREQVLLATGSEPEKSSFKPQNPLAKRSSDIFRTAALKKAELSQKTTTPVEAPVTEKVSSNVVIIVGIVTVGIIILCVLGMLFSHFSSREETQHSDMGGKVERAEKERAVDDKVPVAKPLTFEVTSVPIGATLFLDGYRSGETPYTFSVEVRDLPVSILLMKEGFESVEMDLNGESTTIETVLVPTPKKSIKKPKKKRKVPGVPIIQ